MNDNDHGRGCAHRTHLFCRRAVKRRAMGMVSRRLSFDAEQLESRVLLSGVAGEDGSGVLVGDPLADQWEPFVPSAAQTEMRAETVADLTGVKVAIHVYSLGYRVSDWGAVKRDGNSFFADAKVEQYMGAVIAVFMPSTFSHQYELGKLDPNARYEFTFQSWGKAVETLNFSIPGGPPVVTVVASDPIAVEPTDRALPDNGEFKVARIGPTDKPLQIHLFSGGTAARRVDYAFGVPEMPPFTDDLYVTIPAGASSASVPVIAKNDNLVEGDETVLLKLVASELYNVVTEGSATVTIKDATVPPPPVVTIIATDPVATEPAAPGMDPSGNGPDVGRYAVTRTGPVEQSLLVTLKLAGTAAEGSDYHLKPQYPIYTFAPLPPGQVLVYFPEGKSSTTLEVIPQGDSLVEGDEAVIAAIVDANGYQVGSPNSAAVTIRDAHVDQWIPYVPTAEQADLAVNTFAGLTVAGVTLRFGSPGFEVRDWGIVKQNGSEFVVDTRIEQWTGAVPMIVPPPVTHQYEFVHLAPGEYAFTFKAWGKTVESIAFKVEAPMPPVVSVMAADPIATEPIRGGPQPRLGSFKVVRVGPTDADLTVQLKVSGTAARPADYLFGAFDIGPFVEAIQVTIPAGHAWVPIPVLAKADAEIEGVETVILTVMVADAYNVGTNGGATVRILDTLSPILRIRDRIDGHHTDVPVPLPDGSGKLDVADNELIVHLPENETTADMLGYVTNLVRSGRNGGSWTGAGIASSAATGDARTGLAVAPNEQDRTIRVKHTWNGDANLDGVVNADDYFRIDAGYIARKQGYNNGDFNYDDVVNADDYFLIDYAFVSQGGPPAVAMPSIREAMVLPDPTRNDPATGISAELFSTEPVL